jgi:hypothetical protein
VVSGRGVLGHRARRCPVVAWFVAHMCAPRGSGPRGRGSASARVLIRQLRQLRQPLLPVLPALLKRRLRLRRSRLLLLLRWWRLRGLRLSPRLREPRLRRGRRPLCLRGLTRRYPARVRSGS